MGRLLDIVFFNGVATPPSGHIRFLHTIFWVPIPRKISALTLIPRRDIIV